MKILKPAYENHLSEIGQNIPAKFSFFNYTEDNKIQRLHEWCQCRDFLGDVLYVNRYNTSSGIYGFSVSKERVPINQEKLQLLVKFPSRLVRDNFKENLSILHGIEEENGISLTTIKQNSALTFVIEADPFWQRGIPFISFYTYILKIMMYKYTDKEKWEDELCNFTGYSVERGYIQSYRENFEKLKHNIGKIGQISSLITGNEEEIGLTIRRIHNDYGFVGVFMRPELHKNNLYSMEMRKL